MARSFIALMTAFFLHWATVPLLKQIVPTKTKRVDGERLQLEIFSTSKSNQGLKKSLKVAQEEKSAPKKKPEPLKNSALEPPKPLVELPPPDKRKRPKKADHTSEWDRQVAKETRARRRTTAAVPVAEEEIQGLFRKNAAFAKEKTQTGEEESQPLKKGVGKGLADEGNVGKDPSTGGADAVPMQRLPRRLARLDLGFSKSKTGRFKEARRQFEMLGRDPTLELQRRKGIFSTPSPNFLRRDGVGFGKSGGQQGQETLRSLMPSRTLLEKTAGMPIDQEQLDELETGRRNAMNTWQWRHGPFMNRVKRQVRASWKPSHAVEMSDPMGVEVRHQIRKTVLMITIDREGHVLAAQLQQSSGAEFLDDEALRAVKNLQFSNPPKEIFNMGDKKSFFFTFILDGMQKNIDFNWQLY